jgi:hypothetical protein
MVNEGPKVVLTSGPRDPFKKADIPSCLDGYFGLPRDSSYDELTELEYHSCYSGDRFPKPRDPDMDVCEPPRFANQGKTNVIGILITIHPKNHELFALT